MKIGLTGPSGSGKTTLAKYIADNYNLTFIPGSAGLIMSQEDKDYLSTEFDYSGEGHRAVINRSATNPDFGYAFQELLLKTRAKKLNESDEFVTDRTPLDNLTYFMLQCAHNQRDVTCNEFIEISNKAFLGGLTHLILVKPHPGWTENNDSRVANNYYQNMTYDVFMGLYYRYLKDSLHSSGIRVLHLDFWNLNSRIQAIDNFLTTI